MMMIFKCKNEKVRSEDDDTEVILQQGISHTPVTSSAD